MEVLLFEPEKYERLYNCSFYNVDDVPLTKRQHPLLGSLFVMMYSISFILYSMCIYGFLVTGLKQRTCYRFMILLGCFHMIGLQTGGLFVGLFAVQGTVFCSDPTFMYIVGSLAMSSWCGSTMTNLILGLNRCCELYGGRLPVWLFGGWRPFLWMALPISYMIYLCTFTTTAPFNSILMAYFFNPHVGYYEDYGEVYYNSFHSLNNMIICVAEPTVYAILVFLYRRALYIADMEASMRFQQEKKIYVQVILVGLVHFTASSVYVIMQVIPFNFSAVLIPTTAYFLSQGLPPIVYICVNRTIRNAVIRRFSAFSINRLTSSVHTLSTQKTSNFVT